jgi:glutamine synthetase
VAEELTQFADELEVMKPADMNEALIQLIRRTYINHKRIIYSGNGYSDEWKAEAKKRGLTEFKTTAESLPHYTDIKNLALFEKHKVYSPSELHARENILLSNYYKVITIEARTMVYMLRKQILPAVFEYEAKLAKIIQTKQASGIASPIEAKMLNAIDKPLNDAANYLELLEDLLKENFTNDKQSAEFAKNKIFPLMETIRTLTDEIETHVSKSDWPIPDYNDILFKSIL